MQVKAWCYYESRLLGAHHGLLSTYALETMVLYIFNMYHQELQSPLKAPPHCCTRMPCLFFAWALAAAIMLHWHARSPALHARACLDLCRDLFLAPSCQALRLHAWTLAYTPLWGTSHESSGPCVCGLSGSLNVLNHCRRCCTSSWRSLRPSTGTCMRSACRGPSA